jgi:hypothetical protein
MNKGEVLDAVKRVDNFLARAKFIDPVLSRMDKVQIATDMKNIYDYIALDENADEKDAELQKIADENSKPKQEFRNIQIAEK